MDAAEDCALPRDLVFVDLETTGGNAAWHRITEVGIVRVERGELVEQWSSLVNPECRIPSSIEAFTGISNEMVADAPRFAELAPIVRAKLDGAVFVAHNARFDYSFLRSEFRRVETHFSAKVLCTVKLSRRLFPDQLRHNLDAVMQRHGLQCAARHRALGDARVLWDFWRKLRADLPEARLAAAVQALLGANALPAYLPPELADELPEGPGVYRLFGADDALLYIGKSVSLRTRVLAHFAGEHDDSKEQRLARQVRRVDWVETAGELGALLREAEWIKTQRPLHNRRLKSDPQAVTIRVSLEPNACARLATVDALGAADLTDCFGLFRSRKDALKALTDIARSQRLCLKVLGLEQSAGSCFAYQLGKCRGACVGKEPLALHGMRLQLALSALKLKAWPFPGRVALRERDDGGGADLHVCEDWAYLGTARSDEDLADLCAADLHRPFDADVYRILVRHFAGKQKLDWLDLRAAIRCA
ncbi:MAG: exonuclease domain-containing protein [Steroidobacteraceae bacterium]|jgi:DNA polymerase-3 subunit epsilon